MCNGLLGLQLFEDFHALLKATECSDSALLGRLRVKGGVLYIPSFVLKLAADAFEEVV